MVKRYDVDGVVSPGGRYSHVAETEPGARFYHLDGRTGIHPDGTISMNFEEQVAGAYSPSPGVIYPTLTLLEELDWIRAIASEGSKKLYEITPDGTLSLKANKSIVESILARMAEASEAQTDDDTRAKKPEGDTAMTPRLRVAMDDLARVIEHRLEDGPLTNDQVAKVVSALANAASDVEKV
jgi:DNA-binding PadR family transcriptional regulator